MARPEIARAFCNKDDPKDSGDCSDQIATIKCNNKKGLEIDGVLSEGMTC